MQANLSHLERSDLNFRQLIDSSFSIESECLALDLCQIINFSLRTYEFYCQQRGIEIPESELFHLAKNTSYYTATLIPLITKATGTSVGSIAASASSLAGQSVMILGGPPTAAVGLAFGYVVAKGCQYLHHYTTRQDQFRAYLSNAQLAAQQNNYDRALEKIELAEQIQKNELTYKMSSVYKDERDFKNLIQSAHDAAEREDYAQALIALDQARAIHSYPELNELRASYQHGANLQICKGFIENANEAAHQENYKLALELLNQAESIQPHPTINQLRELCTNALNLQHCQQLIANQDYSAAYQTINLYLQQTNLAPELHTALLCLRLEASQHQAVVNLDSIWEDYCDLKEQHQDLPNLTEIVSNIFLKFLPDEIRANNHNCLLQIDRYLELNPQDQNMLRQRSVTEYHLDLQDQRYTQLLEKCRPKVLLQDPDALLYSGIALMQLNNFCTAEKYFVDLIKIDQYNVGAHLYLSAIYAQKQDLYRSKIMAQRAELLAKDKPELANQLSYARTQLERIMEQTHAIYAAALGNVIGNAVTSGATELFRFGRAICAPRVTSKETDLRLPLWERAGQTRNLNSTINHELQHRAINRK